MSFFSERFIFLAWAGFSAEALSVTPLLPWEGDEAVFEVMGRVEIYVHLIRSVVG